MYRKGLILIVALFYLLGSAGLMVSLHQCMGRFSSVSFSHETDHEDGTCDRCGMDRSENACCRDQQFHFKIDDSHQPSQVIGNVHLSQFFTIPTVIYQSLQSSAPDQLNLFADGHAPPVYLSNKRYRFLEVFRI